MRRNDWLLGQLPMGMLDDDFFVRFVSIFQESATDLLEGADNVENLVDVSVAPEAMVRYLGSWLGIDSIDASLPPDLQRRIVRETGQILAWRGTKRGLLQFLELVSDGPVEIEESGGIFGEGEAGLRPPFVKMKVDSTGWATEKDFIALVRDEIPANVSFELFIRNRRVWPAQDVEAVA